MKLCKKCNIEKPLNDFCSRKGEIDGKHRYCKPCLKNENDLLNLANYYKLIKINKNK